MKRKEHTGEILKSISRKHGVKRVRNQTKHHFSGLTDKSGGYMNKFKEPLPHRPVRSTMNRTIMFSLLFMLITVLPGWGATYYVKSGGNDGAAGMSDATAWATIAKVNSTVKSGDTVYFRSQDTWTGSMTIATAGVTYNGSTYGSGTRASIKAVATQPATVYINASNTTFNGFDVDMNGQITGGIYAGTYATSDVSNITIDNCKVHNNSVPSGNFRYGIHVGGYAADNIDVDTVTITNTDVYDTGHEGFAIYPTWTKNGCTAKNVTIRNCSATNTGRDGDFWGNGVYIVNKSSNVLIEYSTFTDNDIGISVGNSPDAYVGDPSNITVRYCIIQGSHNVGFSFSAGTATYGTTASGINVYGNIILGGTNGSVTAGGNWNTSEVNFYNNTVYNNSASNELALYFYNVTGTGTPFHIKNNIFMTNGQYVIKLNSVRDETIIDHSNNLLHHGSGTYYMISPDGSARNATYVAGTWDATAKVANPNFTGGTLPTGFTGTYGVNMVPNTNFFAITSGAALNNGATLGSPYNGSINGAGLATPATRPAGAYDIGAYNYDLTATTTISAPTARITNIIK